MRRLLSIYILIMSCLCVMAQTDRQHIRKGNRVYRQQKFDKSEIDYRKAVDKNQNNAQALYNLGCALMQQQKDSAAVVQFEKASKLETNKKRKAMVFHNIGVVCQNHQMFAEAIENYKESLRNNPGDNETRYNLALCQRQMKNQKQKQQQNQDNKDQNKDKNGQDNKKEQNKDQDKNQEKKDQKQTPKEQMSKENAEQLLQAAMQEEKNTQQKMKPQQTGQNRRLNKNW